ncbi:hypothetical protein BJ742DRAFT_737639 [Cladochytrium replicatum]|nr:hypothetical protein BJ742DRAFT_737639 [Cladochytrium replicatum]
MPGIRTAFLMAFGAIAGFYVGEHGTVHDALLDLRFQTSAIVNQLASVAPSNLFIGQRSIRFARDVNVAADNEAIIGGKCSGTNVLAFDNKRLYKYDCYENFKLEWNFNQQTKFVQQGSHPLRPFPHALFTSHAVLGSPITNLGNTVLHATVQCNRTA